MEWFDITEYWDKNGNHFYLDKCYQISDDGSRIRTTNYRYSGKTRELKILSNGCYKRVMLRTSDGNTRGFYVHRLQACNRLENPDKSVYLEVNHINENGFDNRIENLEWCTTNYNVNYGTRTERAKKSLTNRSDLSKRVLCVERNEVFNSLHDVKRELGFVISSISLCCNGKRKTAHGYHWQYI